MLRCPECGQSLLFTFSQLVGPHFKFDAEGHWLSSETCGCDACGYKGPAGKFRLAYQEPTRVGFETSDLCACGGEFESIYSKGPRDPVGWIEIKCNKCGKQKVRQYGRY
jgi:hypothetical protein